MSSNITYNITRRNFIKKSLVGFGTLLLPGTNFLMATPMINKEMKKIKITTVDSQFEREPLLRPFGFKGGYLSELWQTICFIKSESNKHAIGLGTQSVLWSDSSIFSDYSESGGNALMYSLTERALQILKGYTYESPIDVIDEIFPELYKFGKKISSNNKLRQTFALNALVSVDNALWILYAKENALDNFDQIIPDEYKSTFSYKHNKVAAIPLISYNVTPAELKKEVDDGYFFMKIKIGQSGTQKEMLQKDMERLTEIHSKLKDVRSPYTKNGKLPYYFDANGRYESKALFMRFLDHAKKIKAFDQIVIVEEPFPEEMNIDVKDIPVRLAADESAHTDKDALVRIQMGYKAIALKPIAKTLSMSMKIAKVAAEHNVPCFCADLTVNPVLVEWNKNVASRLDSFPGLDNLGLLESNGHQNYKNWKLMQARFPQNAASWIDVRKGFYDTDKDFYINSGGIFDSIPYYENMFLNK